MGAWDPVPSKPTNGGWVPVDDTGDKTPVPTSEQPPTEAPADSDSFWKEAGRAGLEGALNTVGGAVGFVPWALDQFGWLPDRLQPLTPSNIVKGAHQLDRDIFGTTPDAPHTWAGQKAAEAIPYGAALLSSGPALLAHGVKGLATKAGVKDLVSALAKRATTNVAAPIAASDIASKITDDPRAQVAAALVGGPLAARAVTLSPGNPAAKAAVESQIARGAPRAGYAAQDIKASPLLSAITQVAGRPENVTRTMNDWATQEALKTIGIKSNSLFGPAGENLVERRIGASDVPAPGTIRHRLDQYKDAVRGTPGTPEYKAATAQLEALTDYVDKNRLVGDKLRDLAKQNPNTDWPLHYRNWGNTGQQYKGAMELQKAAANNPTGRISPEVAAAATEGNTNYPKLNQLMKDITETQKGPPPKDRITPVLGGIAGLGAAGIAHGIGHKLGLSGYGNLLPEAAALLLGKATKTNLHDVINSDNWFRKPAGWYLNSPPGQWHVGNEIFTDKTFPKGTAIPKAGFLGAPFTTKPEDQ